ncbi:MAG: hypothetical protein M1831_004271 [Alyxoria varia]|nr:MAG: hypothetical protein M1831_004271 [Alyxoria varia]
MPPAEQPIQLLNLLPNEEAKRKRILLEAERQCNVQRDIIQDIPPSTPLQGAKFTQSILGDLAQFAQKADELNPALDLVAYKQAWELVVRKPTSMRTRLFTFDSRVLKVLLDQGFVWQKPSNLDQYLVSGKGRGSRRGG